MSRKMFDGTQWATLKSMANSKEANLDDWIPEQEKPRIAAYLKYDQMYWNDVNQYELRVLEGENPIYIPNPRIIVDTTAHYLLKGLKLTCKSVETQKVLDNFLKRKLSTLVFLRLSGQVLLGVILSSILLLTPLSKRVLASLSTAYQHLMYSQFGMKMYLRR